jgi:hypothetical protein
LLAIPRTETFSILVAQLEVCGKLVTQEPTGKMLVMGSSRLDRLVLSQFPIQIARLFTLAQVNLALGMMYLTVMVSIGPLMEESHGSMLG